MTKHPHHDRIHVSTSKGEVLWRDMNPKHLRAAAFNLKVRASRLTGKAMAEQRKLADEMEAYAEYREKEWIKEHSRAQ